MTSKLLNLRDEEIMRMALEPLLAEFLTEPSQDLFHYTTGDGFLKIIESKKLLATHISCLNDTSEVLYAIEKFRDKLEGKLTQPLPSKIKQLFERLKLVVDDERIENSPVYVACFSAVDDDLSQWRAYGGGEGGYAIRFDGTELRKKDGSEAVLVKVWYDETEQERLLSRIVTLTERTFTQLSAYQAEENMDTLISVFFENWLRNLYFLAPCFKHHKFSAEQEWRYISYLGGKDASQRRFVQKSSMLVRQIFLNWNEKLPITGITVGPCRHVPQSMSAVTEYMEMYDYKVDADFVKRTAVPFRQL